MPLPHVESVDVDVAGNTVTLTGGDPVAAETAIVEGRLHSRITSD